MTKYFYLLALTLLIFFAAPATSYAQLDHLSPRYKITDEGSYIDENTLRKNYAFKYYERCNAVKIEGHSQQAQDDTCMCQAVHMMEYLRTPELEVMATGKGNVNVNNERLIPHVYAPCFEFYVEEQEYASCLKNKRVTRLNITGSRAHAVCECAKLEIANASRELAPAMLDYRIKRYPDIANRPFEYFIQSEEMSNERNKAVMHCIQQLRS
jgi:hypothetical protein